MKSFSLRSSGSLALLALLLLVGLSRCWKLRIGASDFALNYAVVNYIGENARWPDESATYLASMRTYPPVGHTVAAIGGWLIGSRLLALHLVSTMCAAAAWAFLFLLLRFTAAKETIVAATGIALAAILLAPSRVLLGFEIGGHFFYAQIFSEACLFALALLWARVRLPRWGEAAAAVIVTFSLGWVYQIAALQFGAFAILWRAIAVGCDWNTARRPPWWEVGSLAILAIAVAAAFLLHPGFASAVQLGTNEGSIYVNVPRMLIVPLSMLLLVAAAVLAAAVMRGRLDVPAGQALAALCGAVALAALAQQAAYFFAGIGSRYLVQKHFYPVCTLLLAAVVVLSVQWSRRFTSPRALWSPTLARFAWWPAALIAFAATNVPWRGILVAPLLRTESFLSAAVHERPELAGHTVMVTGDQIMQMTFSFGVLRLPAEAAAALTIENPSKERWSKFVRETPITHAVVATPRVRNADCIVAQDYATALALVDYSCQTRSAGRGD